MFHRSVPGFVLQGGGIILRNTPSGDQLQWVPTYAPIVNEFSSDRSNLFGTIAMAKTAAGPDSATSQWFFNLGNNSANLDYQNGGFTVFGHIVAGLDVLLAIEALNVYQFNSPFAELPTLDTFTEEDYYAGYAPFFSDLVWLYSAVLLADANGDGVVDAADYMTVKQNFGMTSGAQWSDGDFNGDHQVNWADLQIMMASFGTRSVVAGSGSVPEPATLSLLALLALSLPRRGGPAMLPRRRSRVSSWPE
jgi:cyclophilin family peptidyl-prolyl cis-trans isomerase